MNKLNNDNLRNVIFGVEDSLVSTVGVLFGVATASNDAKLIITTGLVVVSVEALSMGAGSYLSERSVQEALNNKVSSSPIIDGFLMFVSYFLAGFIPLLPYFLLDVHTAKYVSVLLALIALFITGYLPSKKLKSGIRMVTIAGLAVLIGFAVASITNTL